MIKNYFSFLNLKKYMLTTLFAVFFVILTSAQQTATIVTTSKSANWAISFTNSGGLPISWQATGSGINITATGNNPSFDFSPNIGNDDVTITITSSDNFDFVTSLWAGNKEIRDVQLSNLENLNDLGVSYNNLTALDLSKNTKLTSLYCDGNQISNLSLDNLSLLDDLEVSWNLLTNLDLSNNINLKSIQCTNNQLTELKISGLNKLHTLTCYANNLNELDLSTNSSLTYFIAESNDLGKVNVKNGTNDILTTFEVYNNSNLGCIQVDNEANASVGNGVYGSWLKDENAYYSENCYGSSGSTFAIPDTNFEQALIDLGIDSDDTINGEMLIEDAIGVQSLDVNNKDIADLTGIEYFTDLQELDCSNNKLSSLDISTQTKVKTLICHDNLLTELFLPQDVKDVIEGYYIYKAPITNLDCSQNQLTSLNLTNNFNIEFLNCSNNNLKDLILPPDFILGFGGQYQLAMLKDVNCSNNNLTVVELGNSAGVNSVNCSFNEITKIIFPRTIHEYWGEPSLSYLNCSNNNFTELVDENNSLGVLSEINCDNNNISKIGNFKVETLSCNDNNLSILSNIGVNDDYLRGLSLANNKFQELDFKYFASLQDLDVSNNELTLLNLVKNDSYDVHGEVVSTGNDNLYCIQVLNPYAASQGISPYDNFIVDDHTGFSYQGGCEPIVMLSSDKETILENGEQATILCSLNLRSHMEVTINVGASGTAPSTNYELSSNQIVVPAGELFGSITLTAKEDQMETDKTVIIDIESVENAIEEDPQQVTVTIIHVNDPPTDINLAAQDFEENVEFDELTKIIVDDIDDTSHTITLVVGDGSDDNDNFFVVGDMLHTKIIFDYEDQKEHYIRLKAEDSGGLSIEKSFVITVINENELVLDGVVTNNYCDDGEIGSIITTVSGQYTPPLSYQWMSGETTPDLNSKPNGTYTLTVTDAVGGLARKDFTISSEPIYAEMSICYITSDEDSPDNNRIYFANQNAYNIDNILILREGIVAGLYDVIGAVGPDEPSFLDTSSDNQVVSYNYKVRIQDKCGNISESSAQHKTVLLQANKAADGSINLSWNEYVGLNYGTYDIYRQENSNDYTLLTSLPSSNLTYNDTDADSATNTYSYYIGITLDEPCNFTVSNQASKSSLPPIPVIKSNIKLISSTLGVDDEELSKSVKIYPNPVVDILTIESPKFQLTKVEVFSLLGATIKEIRSDFESIDMSALSKGIYMIKLQSEYGTTVKKLIKQ